MSRRLISQGRRALAMLGNVLAQTCAFNHPLLMPKLIERPTRVAAAGTKPKIIEEFIGRVNTNEARISIAHMRSPGGWLEPGQTPEFDEYTVVLKGVLRVEFQGGQLDVRAGQAVLARAGEWVRYSTP